MQVLLCKDSNGRSRADTVHSSDLISKWESCTSMKFSDLERSALHLNELYEQLEVRKYGRVWSTEELALGFVGDVGDLAKLIQAHAGIRDIDDCKAKLGHELADCLWSIMILASKCGVDLESEFVRNTRELAEHVSSELDKQQPANLVASEFRLM